jgi:hypothetical protein
MSQRVSLNDRKEEELEQDKMSTTISSIVSPESIEKIQDTLDDKIKKMVAEIENMIIKENTKTSLSTISKDKKCFEDKYPSMNVATRPEIQDVINLINKETGARKYQIYEILLINGLKNTTFED